MAQVAPEHKPILLWLVNNWGVVHPQLEALSSRADPKVDVILVDLRIVRGSDLTSLNAQSVLAAARVIEVQAVRSTLSSHPLLYAGGWAKDFSKHVKQTVKAQAGSQSCACLFAYGDAAQHAADQDDARPDFMMNVALFFFKILKEVAEHNLRALAVQRAVALRRLQLAQSGGGSPASQSASTAPLVQPSPPPSTQPPP